MTLEMTLELEGDDPDWDAMAQAAKQTGVYDFNYAEGKQFEGFFEKSYVYFGWVRWEAVCQPIMAEGYHGCDFLTRCTIVFRVNNSLYDESVQDIKDFLTHLSELSTMQFVLSFQYEEVRAVRCKHGFDFFWHDGRGPNWRPPNQLPDQPERRHPTLLKANPLRRFLNKLHLRKH